MGRAVAANVLAIRIQTSGARDGDSYIGAATARLMLLFPATLSAAFARAHFAPLLAAATPALLAASALLVHSGPGAAFRFFLRCAALLVALLDMFRFALLFAAVFRFAPTCHNSSSF